MTRQNTDGPDWLELSFLKGVYELKVLGSRKTLSDHEHVASYRRERFGEILLALQSYDADTRSFHNEKGRRRRGHIHMGVGSDSGEDYTPWLLSWDFEPKTALSGPQSKSIDYLVRAHNAYVHIVMENEKLQSEAVSGRATRRPSSMEV
jgi:hypothetical protein